jgi:hypothetical protein
MYIFYFMYLDFLSILLLLFLLLVSGHLYLITTKREFSLLRWSLPHVIQTEDAALISGLTASTQELYLSLTGLYLYLLFVDNFFGLDGWGIHGWIRSSLVVDEIYYWLYSRG